MLKGNLAARAIALAFALTMWPGAIRAQTSPATVRPTPATLEIGVGQTVAVAIQLENVEGAYGIDVSGRFNPAVVEIVGASAAAPLSAGGFIKPDFVVVNTIDNQAGTFHWAATQMNPAEPVSGSGPVVVFSLRGKASGQSSLIELTAVEVANANGAELPVTLAASSVAVVGPGGATSVPAPTEPAANATAPAPAATPTVGRLPVNTPLPPVFSTSVVDPIPQAPPPPTAPPARSVPVATTAAPEGATRATAVAPTPVARASDIAPTRVAGPTQAPPAPAQGASEVKSPSPTPTPVASVPTAIAALLPANVNANVPPAAFAPGSLAPAAPLGGVKPPAAVALPLSPEPSPPATSPFERVGISAALIALGLLGWRLFSGATRSA